ncbi:hypothetical protein AB5J62_12300 [Amycolatopsis sp. cg5]|uniref:hypothetical protein n=1 Tax=Amycolatopsis sp. cg5 TaxID=3238802 RepID=UPI003523382B
MNYLRSFLPWIAFAVVATQFDWRYSALIGVVLSAGTLLWERRNDRAWDSLVIELSALGFFVLLTAIAFAFPDSAVRDQVDPLSSGWLALTAWLSIAIKKPFTFGIARTMVPRELWTNPVFFRTNVIITAVWAASFTVHAIAGAILLAYAPHATAALITIKVLGFAVPIAFTVRYPKIVRARATAHTAQ